MRVGIDIGGTFTDLVAATDEGILVAKVASTPHDPSQGFREALSRVDAAPDEVLHGTTVGTNAVLTRSGARLVFVATAGFEHVLHLARQARPSLYDLRARPPAPLVERSQCVGVEERIAGDGSVLLALQEQSVRRALDGLPPVEGAAVVLLHSYANSAHERRIAALVRETLGDVAVSLSSDVLPEFREYERASTTALNAYVQPVVSRYLDAVRGAAAPSRIGVMWSGGGVRGVEQTIERPVHTLYSGPAAGVLGAAWAAEVCGATELVTLDMGGTSADVALVEDGRPSVAEESSLDGLPFRTPCIDVVSVGAGGGSVAWVDEGGALRVGPASAGADPGPAAYGRGGKEATVTDAQVVLGYLDALAGGELRLDPAAAHAAVERVARRCAMEPIEAAEGVLRVVRATMSRAIRSVSIERGKDVRRYTLVAFGGAGPLHATALARELGISRVIVPPAPGALAALGLLVASRRADASLSRPMLADRARDAELRSILHELTERVLGELREEGIDFSRARTELAVDCRYAGQSHELRIEVAGGPSFVLLAEAFHAAHHKRYGFADTSAAVEAVTFRASAEGPSGSIVVSPPEGRPAEVVAKRRVGPVEVAVYDRPTLGAGARITGPAIISELDSTTWLDDNSTAVVAPGGALLIEVGA